MAEKESQILPEIFELVKTYLPFISTIGLSVWGGTVSHIQKLRRNATAFKWSEYIYDLIICSFAGLLTYFFCQYANIDGWLSAILISVSAHMGTRAISKFERMHSRILDSDSSENQKQGSLFKESNRD